MIEFAYNTDFKIEDEQIKSDWISAIIEDYNMEEGELLYTFCSDDELHKINMEALNHDTLTDIISFDYTMGELLSGDIFISIDRVKENAIELGIEFQKELQRVMIHGVLHYIGFKDHSDNEKTEMRKQEDYCLTLHP